MPFKSKAQQRWMFANHPEMAKRWADHTPDIKKLPETVEDTEKQSAITAVALGAHVASIQKQAGVDPVKLFRAFAGSAGNTAARTLKPVGNAAFRAASNTAQVAGNAAQAAAPAAKFVANVPVTYAKNLAGLGPGGNLEGTTKGIFRQSPNFMGPVHPNAHAFIAPKSLNFGSFGNYLNPGTGAAAGGTLGYGAGAGLDAFDAHVGNKNYNWAAKLGLAGLTAGSGIGGVPQFIRSRIPINPLAAASNAFSRNVIAPLERSGGPIAQGIINSGRLATNLAFTPKMRPFYQMFPKTVADSLGTAESLALGGVGAYGAWQGINALPDAARNFVFDNLQRAREEATSRISQAPEWLRNTTAQTAATAGINAVVPSWLRGPVQGAADERIRKLPKWQQGTPQEAVDTIGDDKKIEAAAEQARQGTWQGQLSAAGQVINPWSNFWKPATPLTKRVMGLAPVVARPIIQSRLDKEPDMKPLPPLPFYARPFGSWSATLGAQKGMANAHRVANYTADQFRSPEALKLRQEQRLEAEKARLAAEKQRASGGGE